MNTTTTTTTTTNEVVHVIKSLADRWAAIEAVSYVSGQITDRGRAIGYALGYAASGFSNRFIDFFGRAAALREESAEVESRGIHWALCARGIFDHEAKEIIDSRDAAQIAALILGQKWSIEKAEAAAAAA